MRQALRLHPDSLCVAATRIEVEVARPRPGGLVLSYVVTGKISDLRLPPVTAAVRAEELWRHTCFEVFVRASPGAGYYEFNFAPSTQWAVYRFSGYRGGMQVATEISAPRIEVQSSLECYTLQAAVELDRLPGLPRDAGWRLGLSALIEEASGRQSYWALAHPSGKADFHHSDCFAYECAPTVRP
ncbi:MAG: DOMON-like domain-containing protein [Xanthobacteraceae bacterium]